jgi:hypothetical protein
MKAILFFIFTCTSFVVADPADLSGLLPGLGSEDFKVREEALNKMNRLVADKSRRQESLEEIRKLWLAETNPEIRARLFTLGLDLSSPGKGSLFGFRFVERPPIEVNGLRLTTISVMEVIADSPAEKAGLRANDLIYGANRRFLGVEKSLDDVLQFFKYLNPEETHGLLVLRGDEHLVIKVKPETQELTRSEQAMRKKKWLQWLQSPREKSD